VKIPFYTPKGFNFSAIDSNFVYSLPLLFLFAKVSSDQIDQPRGTPTITAVLSIFA
jgi:hypothetical protein